MEWILQNARINANGDLVDVGIDGGKIVAVEPRLTAVSAQTWDLAGRVLLPGLVDIHTHLDKTYSTIENQSGTLLEAIRIWGKERQRRTREQVRAAVTRALKTAVSNGLTAMRSHIDSGASDETLDTILQVRDEWRDKIDLQLVALGIDGVDMARLERHFGFLGGAPALHDEPQDKIDRVFELAERLGKPIDFHIDETEDPTMLTLEYVAEQTVARGMVGQVTAGHCVSLAFVDEETAVRVIEKVAKAEINIVTLPSCNLVLMGREMSPTPRGTTRVKQLLAGGVNVCAASDNVHDPFNPFGSYDLLQIANINAHVAHMTGESELYESLAMVTARPSRAMGLGGGKIGVGKTADLVVVDCQTMLEAVVSPPARLGTFKNGRLIVKTEIKRSWYDL
ncbi:MAG: amidohydrolase family protein [Chloroflexota bacterium]